MVITETGEPQVVIMIHCSNAQTITIFQCTGIRITDKLHETFNFRTDTEIVPPGVMRSIIAGTKKMK